jgi:hypothetical protein
LREGITICKIHPKRNRFKYYYDRWEPYVKYKPTRKNATRSKPASKPQLLQRARTAKLSVSPGKKPCPSHRRMRFVLTFFNKSSQFIRTAAFLYFLLSSRNRPDSSPIRSRLSPRYNRSSIFLVITFVTSRSSSFSLSRFWEARLSWYVFLVRWMKVSNWMKAYGRRFGE